MLKMKQKSSAKHISSFFIEIILVVFFFSIACAIIVQIFGKAYINNNKADKINSAITKGQNLSEVFSSKGEIEDSFYYVFGDINSLDHTNDSYTATFNKKWQSAKTDIYYSVIVTPSTEKSSLGIIIIAKIEIYNKNELLFSTTSSKYLSGEAELHE